MEKTRDLFKKVKDIKRTFHEKRAEIVWTYQKQKILRRGGKNTQKVKVKTLSRVRLFATPWTVA